jgi:hypothetical protein
MKRKEENKKMKIDFFLPTKVFEKCLEIFFYLLYDRIDQVDKMESKKKELSHEI